VKEITFPLSEHGGVKKWHELERTSERKVNASGVKFRRTGRYVRGGATTSHVTEEISVEMTSGDMVKQDMSSSPLQGPGNRVTEAKREKRGSR
jgi:hypothetical protein